jgi:putative oxidoreductase
VLFAARSSAPPFLLSHDGAERVDWGTRVTKKGAPGTTERTPRPKRETEMDYAAPYLKLIGRVILSLIFIQSGIGKIFDFAGTQAMMEQHGLPGWLLVPTILVEAGGGLCVLTGWFTRWAALALAGFCGLAAIFFHMDFGDRMQMINFMKNITIAGGFLVLAGAGPGALALDNRR